MSTPAHNLRAALLALACGLLAACGSKPVVPTQVDVAPVDFSGDWEVDYAQGESVAEVYESTIRALERQVRRQAEGQGTISGSNIVYGNGQEIYDLARMAEVVTEPQLLHIMQEEGSITVKRDGSFALECQFALTADSRRDSPFGNEDCGWVGDQLYFYLQLPGALRVTHRLSISADGHFLQLLTRLSAGGGSQPFSVAQVLRRYDPNRSGITCRQTLSKGKVCTTERSAP